MVNQKDLFNKLDLLLERHTYREVTKMLGYRNSGSVHYWKRVGKIPKGAVVEIEKLFNKKEIKNAYWNK